MGTRADFYVGRNPETMQWLGSLGEDGYPDGLSPAIFKAQTEAEYRNVIEHYIQCQRSGTMPHLGWPWPWNNSRTTDYSYAFDAGTVYVSKFGSQWVCIADPDHPEKDLVFDEEADQVNFPDMSAIQNVDFGVRSGATFIGL